MKTKTIETLAETTIPVTSRQAFKILDEMLSDEEIRSFLSQSKSAFVTDQHFGLGLWIRNNWIYGDEDEAEVIVKRREACCAMLGGRGYNEWASPDMLSSMFLGRYYDHLKRTKKL